MAGAEDGEDGLGEAEPTDRAVAHGVAPSNVHQALPRCASRQCFAPLVWGQCQLAAEPDPSRLGPGPALASPGQDQASLEFGEPTKDRYH